jgi:hypothetical protein
MGGFLSDKWEREALWSPSITIVGRISRPLKSGCFVVATAHSIDSEIKNLFQSHE